MKPPTVCTTVEPAPSIFPSRRTTKNRRLSFSLSLSFKVLIIQVPVRSLAAGVFLTLG